MNLAPIVLFVYNRPEATRQTIEQLQKNYLAKESILYIFSDGPKTEEQAQKVKQVREILKQAAGFKEVQIFHSNENNGLARSIIHNASYVLQKHGKAIVLEDDLLTSPYFLTYMNDALHFYSKKNHIWSISGYTPFLKTLHRYPYDVYLIPRACSWGWATWLDRWEKIDWEVKDYQDFQRNKKQQKLFNKTGTDMSFTLRNQMNGYIDSWAVRWCYSQFSKQSYTVYPKQSFIKNIGLAGEGTHGSFNKKFAKNHLTDQYEFGLSDPEVNKEVLKEFASIYNLRLVNYMGAAARKMGLYKKIKRLKQKKPSTQFNKERSTIR